LNAGLQALVTGKDRGRAFSVGAPRSIADNTH
jgi:hypothetical protein